MKRYIRRTGAALLLGIFLLPALTPSVEPQTRPWWFYGCPKGVVAQIPGDVPGPGTAGWTQYQSCLQQNLSVSPQQSAQIAPILANEGSKVIAIRTNNSLSDVQKIQEVKFLQKQADPQLKIRTSPLKLRRHVIMLNSQHGNSLFFLPTTSMRCPTSKCS